MDHPNHEDYPYGSKAIDHSSLVVLTKKAIPVKCSTISSSVKPISLYTSPKTYSWLKVISLHYIIPNKGKRNVYTIHCHPINLLLPALPVPPNIAITKSTHIHVVTIFIQHLWNNEPNSFFAFVRIVSFTAGRGEGISIWSPSSFSPQETVELQ